MTKFQLIILRVKACKQSFLTSQCLCAELSPQNCLRHSQAQSQRGNPTSCSWDSGNCSAKTSSSAQLAARTGGRSEEKNHLNWNFNKIEKNHFLRFIPSPEWFLCIVFSIEFDRVIPHEISAKNNSSVFHFSIDTKDSFDVPAVIVFFFFLRIFWLFCLPQSIGRISPDEEIATD